MNTILFNIKRRAFSALQNKAACDQLVDAFASMKEDEQYNFYQYFVIDKMTVADALDLALFPSTNNLEEELEEWDE